MMATNLFVIANVKQLRTDSSFRILLPFSRTSWGVGVLNSTIFNSFHNWVEFGTILEGLRNFGVGGWGWTPKPPPPPRPATVFQCHCVLHKPHVHWPEFEHNSSLCEPPFNQPPSRMSSIDTKENPLVWILFGAPPSRTEFGPGFVKIGQLFQHLIFVTYT